MRDPRHIFLLLCLTCEIIGKFFHPVGGVILVVLPLSSAQSLVFNIQLYQNKKSLCKMGCATCLLGWLDVHQGNGSVDNKQVLVSSLQMPRKRKTRHSSNPPLESHVGWVMDSREHRPRTASIRYCGWANQAACASTWYSPAKSKSIQQLGGQPRAWELEASCVLFFYF